MSLELVILLSVFLPLVAAGPVAWMGRGLGARAAWVALPFPVIAFLALAWAAAALGGGAGPAVGWPWVPTLGVELKFLVDGLSVFFGLIVSGVGALVVIYSAFYLDGHYAHHGRFYAYLLLFMASMLGAVLADNLLALFVFWEMTGIASFLLIGFLHGEEGSRRGARMALLVTAGTGLAMLAGIILIGQIAGTASLRELLAGGGLAGRPMAGAAMALLLLGAFGKSAQFPFHFWLPNAMAAPTPVSAYLHSATMVKLGVYLVARVFPLFNEHAAWSVLVGTVAFATLIVGSVLALLSNELKAILAFSTVSQLGLLIGYYGLGPSGGVSYDYLHILNHVCYKGALFMVAGAIYHATHLKDVRELGGLWRRSRWLGVVTAVACAAMLGMPGTTGFLSKELMFKEIFVSPRAHGPLGILAVVAVVGSTLIKVAFSIRIFQGVFLGRESEAVARGWRGLPWMMLLPPTILAAGLVVLGVAPELLAAAMHWLNVPGLHAPDAPVLHLWHGVTAELLASIAVVASGLALWWWGRVTGWRWARIPAAFRWDEGFDAAVDRFGGWCGRVTRLSGAESPRLWLGVVIGAVVLAVCLGAPWAGEAEGLVRRIAAGAAAQDWDALRVGVAAIVALGAIGAAVLRSWPAQLISLSTSGFISTLYFALYHAPDLALTQILVETVTLVLVLYLLARFPRSAQEGEDGGAGRAFGRWWRLGVAAAFGTMMAVVGLVMTSAPHADPVGPWYVAHTVPLAEGANAVNTILVDFRALDTLGEISVLVVAMLGCLGLLMRRRGPGGDGGVVVEAVRVQAGGPESMILVMVARLVFFVLNAFAIYLLWRGHNAPGGGFIAGLVSAISLVMLSLALGWEELHRVLRFDPGRLAVWGLAVAALPAAAPMVLGRPMLEQYMWSLAIWPIGKLHVGTPLVFDVGVFLVVVGIASKMLFVLGKSTCGFRALVGEEEARYASPADEPIERARPGGGGGA